MKKCRKEICSKSVFRKLAFAILLAALLSSGVAQAKTISYHMAPKLQYTCVSATSSQYSDLWVAYSDDKSHLINSNGDVVYDAKDKDIYNAEHGVYILERDTFEGFFYDYDGTLIPVDDLGFGIHKGMIDGVIYNAETKAFISAFFYVSEDNKQVVMEWYDDWTSASEMEADSAVTPVYIVKNFVKTKDEAGGSTAKADFVGMAAAAHGEFITGNTYYKEVSTIYESKEAKNASDALLGLQNNAGKWAIAESNGTLISQYEYDAVSVFGTKHNIAAVKKGGVWGFVNNPVTYTGTTPDSAKQTATPTASKIMVNGSAVSFGAYTINDNNYFKLRDVASVLSGSKKQFEVTWDGAKNAIALASSKPYTTVGGELNKGDGTAKAASLSAAAIYLDGKEIKLTAYTINENNYFKLRDLGAAFDFNVSWDEKNNTIVVNADESYTAD